MQIHWYPCYANHILQVECEFKETSKHSSSLKKVSNSGYLVEIRNNSEKNVKFFFTITAEIFARSLANFYRQLGDRHMNV